MTLSATSTLRRRLPLAGISFEDLQATRRGRATALPCGLLVAAFLLVLATAAPSLAGQTDPVTITVPDDLLGDSAYIGFRPLPPGYVEEDYLVAGTADIYNYTAHPGSPGSLTVVTAAAPYQTRMVIRRPSSAAQFNGTVVIEWWNSTAGFDNAQVWDASAEYFGREGIIYVGVTNATSSISWLVNGCRLGGFGDPQCGTRYATLNMSDNGQAYDMLSQIAHVLKTGGVSSPLPVGFDVDRLFHSGQSQQGGSVVAYATNFHFAANDGYFIQAASTARRINDDVSCDDAGAPAYPNCRAELQGTDRLVRTDLPVPVVRAVTETDVTNILTNGVRQSDAGFFRYYEMAGTAHVAIHKGVDFQLGPQTLSLDELCDIELNTLADGPVLGSPLYNAMFENMAIEVDTGDPMPAGLVLDSTGGVIDRDADDNALGGLRIPLMEYPIATYGGHNTLSAEYQELPIANLLNLFCALAGTVEPFPQSKILQLYGPAWKTRYDGMRSVATQLLADRYILVEDYGRLVHPAVVPAMSPIGLVALGCGLFGAALFTARRLYPKRQG